MVTKIAGIKSAPIVKHETCGRLSIDIQGGDLMFCRQCGAESLGGTFCAYCGARLYNVSAADADNERKELLTLLEKVHSVAEKCAPYFDEYNYLEGMVNVCSYRRYENNAWKIIFWVGLPFAILFSVPMFLFMGSFELTGGLGGFLSVAVPVLAMITGWIIVCIVVKDGGEKRNRQMLENDQRKINEARERQNLLREEIESIFYGAGVSKAYPIEYLHIDAVNEICSYVNSMRADTLKEAINLYEETNHR